MQPLKLAHLVCVCVSIVDVVVLFAGKVISLDTSDTAVFSGVCARSSLSRTLLLSLDRQLQGLQGYKVCLCAHVHACERDQHRERRQRETLI